MKLIRLATDNNGVFKSSFGNDMTIEKDSKMALLNLTFKTQFETIDINPTNNSVTFKSDLTNADTETSGSIVSDVYTSQGIEDYYDNVELGLNSALSLTNSVGSGTNGYNSIPSLFKLHEVNGLRRIDYRFTPLLNPFVTKANGPDRMFFNASDTPQSANLDIATTGNGQTIIKAINASHVDNRSRNTFGISDRHLNHGNALYMARARDIRNNGTGLQDNGFGIGLAEEEIPQSALSTDLASVYRKHEIRVNRVGENYVYIENGGLETTSTVAPAKIDLSIDADANDHDVLAFEISNGNLNFCVYQDVTGTGTRQVLNTIKVEAGKKYYPYFYIRGGNAHCIVDMLNISLDPFMDANRNDEWELTGQTDDTAFDNFYEALLDSASAVRDAIPQVERFGRWDPGNNFTTRLTLNAEVWKSLGYTTNGKANGNVSEDVEIGSNYFANCWSWWQPQSAPIITDSDNFVVVSDSLPLDSFDASKAFYTTSKNFNNPVVPKESDRQGRRKNILMTIPVNDNTNGLVEYETSTPIFIGINNAEKMNVKNLNFRLLRGDFTPILASEDETAYMTILIDN